MTRKSNKPVLGVFFNDSKGDQTIKHIGPCLATPGTLRILNYVIPIFPFACNNFNRDLIIEFYTAPTANYMFLQFLLQAIFFICFVAAILASAYAHGGYGGGYNQRGYGGGYRGYGGGYGYQHGYGHGGYGHGG